jgi:hypothetical protein
MLKTAARESSRGLLSQPRLVLDRRQELENVRCERLGHLVCRPVAAFLDDQRLSNANALLSLSRYTRMARRKGPIWRYACTATIATCRIWYTHLVLLVIHHVVQRLQPVPRGLGDFAGKLRIADRLGQASSKATLGHVCRGAKHLDGSARHHDGMQRKGKVDVPLCRRICQSRSSR